MIYTNYTFLIYILYRHYTYTVHMLQGHQQSDGVEDGDRADRGFPSSVEGYLQESCKYVSIGK